MTLPTKPIAPSRRPARVFRATFAALLLLAVGLGSAATSKGRKRPPKPAPGGIVTTTADPTWTEVDRLVSEQKMEEAARLVETMLAKARSAGNDAGIARTLVRLVQLRTALHGYETSVRFLRDQPWPEAPLPKTELRLFYARSLVHYVSAYGWEIGQRERTEAKGPIDLKAWTRDQIAAEAVRAYVEIWNDREALSDIPAKGIESIEPSNYPEQVRGTLRDTVSYLFVELLADSSLWNPADSNRVWELDRAALVRGGRSAGILARLDDPQVHPLEKLGAVLSDLEEWHERNGDAEAALEARLERARRLAAAFDRAEDDRLVREDLAERLPRYRRYEWWSVGMAQLAGFVQAEQRPEALVEARRIAKEGMAAYPQSPGGIQCRAIVVQIEAPDFQLQAMTSDGANRRSIEVQHRNLAALHFRAFRLDLVSSIEAAKDYNVLPAWREIPEILANRRPDLEWKLELPATPDFRQHRTFTSIPAEKPGLYVVVASAKEGFPAAANRRTALNVVVTDLVVVSRAVAEAEVEVLSGATGEPIVGASVMLYARDWQKGHRKIRTLVTDRGGMVRFDTSGVSAPAGYFLVAKKGADETYDTGWFSKEAAPPGESTSALLYTDRSIYRPGQKIHWKVVGYSGGGDPPRYRVNPGAVTTVTLHDANGQQLEVKTVTTGAHGSASGEFIVPAGKLLGAWWIRTSTGGGAQVRVEEYKRPTFEAKVLEPEKELRLNRPARLRGEVKYHFGLPVVTGSVRWRITREAVWPWWWGWWGRRPGAGSGEIVASGAARLDAEGHFDVDFTPAADEREGKDVSYRFTLAADVTDEGGETRSASRSFRLGFVSIEASLAAERAFLRPGTRTSVALRRTDLDGVPRAGTGSWKLIELEGPGKVVLPADVPKRENAELRTFETPGDRMRPRWESNVAVAEILAGWKEGRAAASGEVAADAKGEGKIELPDVPPGAYRLVYETKDAAGATATAKTDLLAAAEGARVPAPLPLVLSAEQGSVDVGGTARLLAFSAIPGERMVLELWRAGRRIDRRELIAGKSATLVELPIRESDRGGFGVTLAAVRDHQMMLQAASVFVPWSDKELRIEVSTFRDRIRPGTAESWRVTVRPPEGSPRSAESAAAEVLAYMYDRSLDLFAPHHPPSPLGLWPNRSQPGSVRGNLGAMGPQWSQDDGFVDYVGAPSFYAARLKFDDGYGIGGPGVRGRMAYAASEMSVMKSSARADAPAPAAAPMRQNELAREKKQEADGVAGGVVGGVVGGAKDAKLRDGESVDAVSAAGGAEPPQLRSNFAETAFWQPHLLTAADGSATIEFTVPDSVTSWNVWFHALTKDLRAASLRKESRSVKELMVRPYLPRFLREGDDAEIRVVVNDAGETPLSGSVELELTDPATGRSRLAEFGVKNASRSFSVKPGGGDTVTFRLLAPRKLGDVAVKVVATSGALSDGEVRPLPVLPSRMHLMQSRFVTLKGITTKTMRFEDLAKNDDPTLENERMVVTVDAQLFYSMLQALPYLVDYPYECTEQTLNRFLSTGIVSSLYGKYPSIGKMAAEMAKRETEFERFDQPDPNRRMALEETPWLAASQGGGERSDPLVNVLNPAIAKATREASLAKLVKSQTSLGAFPWFPGGPPSPWMTLYVCAGFSKGLEFRVDAPKDVVVRAFAYLHRHYLDELLKEMLAHDCCWEFVTWMNYVLSSYPDESWTGGVFTADERKTMLDHSFKHWRRHSPMLKGYLALTLKRMGRAKDAKLVWDSVMDSAKSDDERGTYWAPEDRSWLWYNDTTETHAFALRTLTELQPKDPRREGLVQWLFLDKKLNHWKSTRATGEVLYSLAHYLEAEGELGIREEISVALGGRKTDFVFEPDRYTGKSQQVVLEGPAIGPGSAEVRVDKTTKGFAFASATWHFSTDRLPAEDRGDFFAVSRKFFRREQKGSEWVLTPLAEGARLAPGDQLEVQLSLRTKHQAEYVHLRDPRGAGFEPENAVSGWRWDLGLPHYQEVRDSGTNFFFEQLPVGEYTFRYRVRAATGGVFRVGPATVQSMYAPEFAAYSAGSTVRIEEGK